MIGHYDGRMWAPGASAAHARLEETERAIGRALRDIAVWERVAASTPGAAGRAQAAEQISGIKFRLRSLEHTAAELRATIEEGEHGEW